MDMSVDVALGTEDRVAKTQFLDKLLTIYQQLLPEGGLGLASPKEVYATLRDLGREAGINTIQPYLTDPTTRKARQTTILMIRVWARLRGLCKSSSRRHRPRATSRWLSLSLSAKDAAQGRPGPG